MPAKPNILLSFTGLLGSEQECVRNLIQSRTVDKPVPKLLSLSAQLELFALLNQFDQVLLEASWTAKNHARSWKDTWALLRQRYNCPGGFVIYLTLTSLQKQNFSIAKRILSYIPASSTETSVLQPLLSAVLSTPILSENGVQCSQILPF